MAGNNRICDINNSNVSNGLCNDSSDNNYVDES